jgi:lysozyme family protein
MADIVGISNWIVRLEDDPRHPGIAKDLGDGAGITRMGITSRWHSADVPAEFFTTMPNEQAYEVTRQFYSSKFCIPLMVPQIKSTPLAASLVSFAVNDNAHVAVQMLQNAIRPPIHVDGAMGPVTVAAINADDPAVLLPAFQAGWEDFYRKDVAANPSKAEFLAGWLRRAALVYPATL